MKDLGPYPPAIRKVTYAAIFLVSFASYLSSAAKQPAPSYLSSRVKLRSLLAPPEMGDGHDYDALAFSLWRHQRFGFDWDEPAWRRPYEGMPGYESLLERHSGYYPTTYRQPAVPALMALVYAIVDAQSERKPFWRP